MEQAKHEEILNIFQRYAAVLKKKSNKQQTLEISEHSDITRFIISIMDDIIQSAYQYKLAWYSNIQKQSIQLKAIEFVQIDETYETFEEKGRQLLLILFSQNQLLKFISLLDRNNLVTNSILQKHETQLIKILKTINESDFSVKSDSVQKFEKLYGSQKQWSHSKQEKDVKIQQQPVVQQQVEFKRIRLDSILLLQNPIEESEVILPTTSDIIPKTSVFITPQTVKQKTFKEQNTKKSQIIYDSQIKQAMEQYQFKQKPAQGVQIIDQLNQCQNCHSNISKGLYIAMNNARYCYYTGYWYCLNCISIEKMPIPWLALEKFDLKKYNVCQDAFNELNKLYNKPIINLSYDDPVVYQNKILYNFLILKRQIHLLYDFICDVNLIHDLMHDKLNLVIKQNVFTLHQLYEIYNNILTPFLQKIFDLFFRHVEGCKMCQKKAITCKICNSQEKVYYFDIKNSSFCKKCGKLYHSQCLSIKHCPHCVLNT